MLNPLTSPTEYRTMLREADALEAKLSRMTGDEADFFPLQRKLDAMETAMSNYSLEVNGYYNHRFSPLAR